MPAKQYSVMLEQDQRESLIGLISTGNQASARKLTRARILLKADEGEFGPAYAINRFKKRLKSRRLRLREPVKPLGVKDSKPP